MGIVLKCEGPQCEEGPHGDKLEIDVKVLESVSFFLRGKK
jgi:hypothetical protein